MTTPTPYVHKPLQVHALQFNGTVDGLLQIFGRVASNPAGVGVSINFDGGGHVGSVTISGALPLTFGPGDWVVFPPDALPYVASDLVFTAQWMEEVTE